MSNLDAALGCAQLERVEDLVARKREILAGYRKRLSAVQQISLNPEPVDGINGAWMPTAVFAPEAGVTREALLAAFKSRQIDARVFFYHSPISRCFRLYNRIPALATYRLVLSIFRVFMI